MLKIVKILLIYFSFILSFAKDEIEISSETMEWKREESIAIAIGEAKAVQGNRVLSADKIIIFFNEKKDIKKIYKLDASGKVRFTSGEQSASGNNATYFVDNETIIIKGNVKLEREDSYMSGEELSIDLKNNSSKLISSNKSGKVRAKYKTEDKNND
ncbi:MAG: Lipopolysaccharide export system protein LptA [Alphaproteobacteria bacterium MarineAlpha9_Bin4]|nr:hypothetical protein [Pelagibacterales bacterium]PPR27340.1 MAG: Lipopolysaccharide export system protein LptA [Alphaproteobacteria bacterium MarineAlpha9_Bin4]|tara:strand:+ start:906 stop:1376 length:471 start_codon:yes stop_codon:yes gene_type:complete